MSNDGKHPGGRPSKYDPAFCEQLIEHMASGYSFESFAGKLSISKQTLYNWAEKKPEFLDAKQIGFEKSRLFWEKIGIGGAAGKLPNFNATSFIFNMKNRFPEDWRDKQEIGGAIQIDATQQFILNQFKMTPEQREARLKAMRERDKEFEESQKLLEGKDET